MRWPGCGYVAGSAPRSRSVLGESFNASLKRETLQGAPTWPDQATCRRAVFGWVNRYNTRRHHSCCGYSPRSYTSSEGRRFHGCLRLNPEH
jgi:transposase InsO family protein